MVSKVRNVRFGVFSGGGCHHPNFKLPEITNGNELKTRGRGLFLVSTYYNRVQFKGSECDNIGCIPSI